MNEIIERLKSELTYTELKVLKVVVEKTECKDGIFNSNDMAKELGIARSILSMVLRFTNVVGITRTRSLGMKGTYIEFLDKTAMQKLVGEAR